MSFQPGRLLALLAILMAGAGAQELEVNVHGGVANQASKSLGSIIQQPTGSDYNLSFKSSFRIGARLTLNSTRFTGYEFGYAYNRAKLIFQEIASAGQTQESGFGIHQGFGNYLLYGVRKDRAIRPFITGGVHFNNYVPPGSSASQGGGSTKFGVNYGAGLKIKLNEKYMVRGDIRQYLNGKPNFGLDNVSGNARLNEISVGFGIVL